MCETIPKKCNFHIGISILIITLLDFVCSLPIEKESLKSSGLDLILLHNNDMHARFEQTDEFSAKCNPEDAEANKCYGGIARVSHIVKQYRKEAENGGTAVLYLNAGDIYAGTPWFSIFRHKVSAEFMNLIKPDAMSLGNHEFDLGVDGLVPFLNAVNFPVLAANINNTADHPLWHTKSLKKSVILEVKGFKIGVIGYLTPETKDLAVKSDVEFVPEVFAINKEAIELKKNGVDIIIALGHSGYEVDKEIAKNCPLINVVVGGHTHSFLFSGPEPDVEKPVGPYPTIIQQINGKQVPVVQAYAFTKYMGFIKLNFDKDGNLLHWDGQPILLNSNITRDPEVLTLEDIYRPKVETITQNVIGVTKVHLDGLNCRISECNIGNFISDAFVRQRVNQYHGPYFTDAPIALIASGDIRASGKIGNITQFDLDTILPFENQLIALNITGNVLRAALEHSVEKFAIQNPRGEFLQVSGLRIVYNISKAPGDRVQSVYVLRSTYNVPRYEPLDVNREYGVIVSSFVYDGGDGFTMFKDFKPNYLNSTVQQTVQDYIQKSRIIYPALEGRITIYKS